MAAPYTDPCVAIDANRVKDRWAAEYLKLLQNHINVVLRTYIDARTTLNENYFDGDEWQTLIQNIGAVYEGVLPWIVIQDNTIAHGRSLVVNTTLGVPGMAIETIGVDEQNHILVVTSAAAGGGDNYHWCRINDGGAHSDEQYNVTEVERTNAGGWQDLAGGLGTVTAINLAEEAGGTHDLPDHTAGAPNVVLVTTKEDEDGDAVYCFRGSVAAAAWTAFADVTSITSGAPGNGVYRRDNTAGAMTDERRTFYAFELAGGNTVARSFGDLWVRVDLPRMHTYIDTTALWNQIDSDFDWAVVTAQYTPATLVWGGEPAIGVVTMALGNQPYVSNTNPVVVTCDQYVLIHVGAATNIHGIRLSISKGWSFVGNTWVYVVDLDGVSVPTMQWIDLG